MGDKFRKVCSCVRRKKILGKVLSAFSSDMFPQVEFCIQSGITDDDEIFKFLSKNRRKITQQQAFNGSKLCAVLKMVHPWINLYPTTKILDFGGATGIAAHNLAKLFRLKKIDVADMHESDFVIKSNKINYTKLDGGVLPYAENQFDVVCAMMTLHHIENVRDTIQELHRVTDRWLIIQEHDATEDYPDILDIVHGMYIFVEKDEDYNKLDSFRDFCAYYKTFSEMNKLICSAGFTLRWSKYTSSAQNNYFALYEKV